MPDTTALYIQAAAPFPNSALPVIIYPQALRGDAPAFDRLFEENGWSGVWVNGVYSFHHFHASAHEALGCLRGRATVLLGGPAGREVTLKMGDAVLLPAGTGHCLLSKSPDFSVAGAYPPGQSPDLQRGEAAVFERLRAACLRVPLPETDPVSGMAFTIWQG